VVLTCDIFFCFPKWHPQNHLQPSPIGQNALAIFKDDLAQGTWTIFRRKEKERGGVIYLSWLVTLVVPTWWTRPLSVVQNLPMHPQLCLGCNTAIATKEKNNDCPQRSVSIPLSYPILFFFFFFLLLWKKKYFWQNCNIIGIGMSHDSFCKN
jgi:hypothetical protein